MAAAPPPLGGVPPPAATPIVMLPAPPERIVMTMHLDHARCNSVETQAGCGVLQYHDASGHGVGATESETGGAI